MSEKTNKESFAERLLKKQGWKEGKGLGKEQQGMVNPIKPSLKFDTTGIGHDMAKEFTTNWWDLAYAKAANKITVEEKNDDGEIEVKTKKSRKRKKKDLKKGLYANFTKSATLANGKLIEDVARERKTRKDSSSSSEEEEIDAKASAVMKVLSDEELYKAAGLTAHKGARHGVTMQEKLRRIEESDRLYLEKERNKRMPK